MQIYLAHSRAIDYVYDLYNPIKDSEELKEHAIYLPHDNNKDVCNGYEFYKKFDLILAEVSHPSTGLGIELGWANMLNIPIVCMYKKGVKITSSLNAVTNKYIVYENKEDMINKTYKCLVNNFM